MHILRIGLQRYSFLLVKTYIIYQGISNAVITAQAYMETLMFSMQAFKLNCHMYQPSKSCFSRVHDVSPALAFICTCWC